MRRFLKLVSIALILLLTAAAIFSIFDKSRLFPSSRDFLLPLVSVLNICFVALFYFENREDKCREDFLKRRMLWIEDFAITRNSQELFSKLDEIEEIVARLYGTNVSQAEVLEIVEQLDETLYQFERFFISRYIEVIRVVDSEASASLSDAIEAFMDVVGCAIDYENQEKDSSSVVSVASSKMLLLEAVWTVHARNSFAEFANRKIPKLR
jgi:hypothetical protein